MANLVSSCSCEADLLHIRCFTEAIRKLPLRQRRLVWTRAAGESAIVQASPELQSGRRGGKFSCSRRE
jgi:hypothetical protein